MRSSWLVLAGRGTTIESWLSAQDELVFVSYPSRYLDRFQLNGRAIRRAVNGFRADVIFHFTAAWRGMPMPQVVRSVYSNLYFPEIQFWPTRPRLTYFKKKLIDQLRLAGTLRADGLIFENRAMQARAQSLFDYPGDRTAYVRPSAALEASSGTRTRRFDREPGRYRVLYLSSWYRNKNIHRLPEVAAQLRGADVKVQFVLSLDADHPEVKAEIVDRARDLEVLDAFEFVGQVHPLDVPACVRSCDAVILLSQLECFSSNVTEAWTFGRPLLISDREWARTECGDAAMYVDRDDPVAIAEAIYSLASDAESGRTLVAAGRRRLAGLNTPASKAREQIEFLERIHRAGKKR